MGCRFTNRRVFLVFTALLGVLPLGSMDYSHYRFRRLALEDGLSLDRVNCVTQDQSGFMWFGTSDGLNRYDGYSVRIYRPDPQNPHALSDSWINCLVPGENGTLWIGTENGGLNRYDPATDRFSVWQHVPRQDGLSSNRIFSVLAHANGSVLAGTELGVDILNPKTGRVVQLLRADTGRALMMGDQNEVWIGTDDGLFVARPESASPSEFDVQFITSSGMVGSILDLHPDGDRLWTTTASGHLYTFQPERDQWEDMVSPGYSVTTLIEDLNGDFWVGTVEGGVFLFKPKSGELISWDSSNPNAGIFGNTVWDICRDRTGLIWLATSMGINIYDPEANRFQLFRNQKNDPDSINSSIIGTLEFDRDQEDILWVGTINRGLNRLDLKTGKAKRYFFEDKRVETLNHSAVFAIHDDGEQHLWLGTRGSGLHVMNKRDETFFQYSIDRHSDSFSHYRNTRPSSHGLSHPIVTGILSDPRNPRLRWIATHGGGLNLLDIDTGRFVHFRTRPGESGTISSDQLFTMYFDSTGGLWIGTYDTGLDYMNSDRKFRNYRADITDEHSLSHNRVSVIYERRNMMWIGTYGGGLNLLDPETGRFRHWRVADGLPNDTVYGILEDRNGYLWLSTNNGLTRFQPEENDFIYFGLDDGVQGLEFNRYSYAQSSQGIFAFGGTRGLTVFRSGDLQYDLTPPAVHISGMRLFNEPVEPWNNVLQHPLEKTILMTDAITLTHEEFVFSFDFVALHYMSSSKNQYSYKLEGFDRDWVYTDADRRIATYTNLPAGTYHFRVKAANKNGAWDEEGTSLSVTILANPWLSRGAMILYAFLILSIGGRYLYSLRSRAIQQHRMAEKQKQLATQAMEVAEQQRSVNERLRQIDGLKDEFLANTSHELRTPLNGIIGLAESLLDGAAGPIGEQMRGNLSIIVSSGRRLSSLVNDILDFSKLKDQGLILRKEAVDLHAVSTVVLALVKPLVGSKNLELRNDVSPDLPLIPGDEDRLQQILFNLLGNAIKFTPEGLITVGACQEKTCLRVWVRDTGIGIPKTEHQRIFTSFEQGDGSIAREFGGTGLGLAVTHQLVNLHGGSIELDSEPGVGSTFYFTLPLADETLPKPEDKTGSLIQSDTPAARGEMCTVPIVTETSTDEADVVVDQEQHLPTEKDGNFGILIVDDDPVNRRVLLNHLGLRYGKVIEASDGQEALRLIEQGCGCDLILLDIMMPGLSGYEVCADLRKRHSMQDLPVIFLTARNRMTALVDAFRAGGNDFLTKPVDKGELLARVRTHLQLLDINRNLEDKVAQRTNELEKRNRELFVQEKMASLGTLTAGIAHELLNPLNFINNFAGSLEGMLEELRENLSRLDPAWEEDHETCELTVELAEAASKIRDHGNRADQILKSMHGMISGNQDTHGTIDLNELVGTFAPMAVRAAAGKEPGTWLEDTLSLELDSELKPIEASAKNIGRVVVNLVNNAVEAILEHRDTIKQPQIRVTTFQDSERTCLMIEDNGGGMSDPVQKDIFTPFFTTRTPGSGHIGLGLTICYEIVVGEHGGQLEIASKEGGETRVTVCLPHAPETGWGLARTGKAEADLVN